MIGQVAIVSGLFPLGIGRESVSFSDKASSLNSSHLFDASADSCCIHKVVHTAIDLTRK